MKKVLGIFIALALIVAFSVPVAVALAAVDDPDTDNLDESTISGDTDYPVTDSGWGPAATVVYDCVQGWGADRWILTLTEAKDLTVTVWDCCCEGDTYEVWVDDCLIGTTPPVACFGCYACSGGDLSWGSFTVSLTPGTYTISFRDSWDGHSAAEIAAQGMCPAGFTVEGTLSDYTGLPWPCPQTGIPTTGNVTGSGSPPIIKAKWELPDDCDVTHVNNTTEVMPEPFGDKLVKFYSVARDPNGADDIANAGFRIEHPAVPDPKPCWMPDEVPEEWGYGVVQNHKVSEGTAWEWVYGTTLDPGPDQVAIQEAIAAAVLAGLLTPAQADDLLYELEQQEARFFYSEKLFDYCWAAGKYEVMAWASDTSGGQGEMVNNLTYCSIIAIDIDFEAGIDYGDLVPTVKQIVSGDEDMGTPNKPTVRSGGNDPIQIKLHATALVGILKGGLIEDFDARLDQFAFIDFKACQDIEVPGVLRPCHTEKMDFSVTPPWGTEADTYVGTMTLWITHYLCPID